MPAPDLSLVIPCFNESAVIRETASHLVEEFSQAGIDLELILVDNGSEDGTGEIIHSLVEDGMPVVAKEIKTNQGYGLGILTGLEAARGTFVGFTCADGQVDSKDVLLVYQIAASAAGPRLAKVRRRFRLDGLKRKLVSVLYNLGTNILFGGLGTLDINGNPKILPRKLLDRMALRSTDWFLDAEMILGAKRLGIEIYELNVLARMRPGGSSNVGIVTCWEFVRNLIRFRFRGRVATGDS